MPDYEYEEDIIGAEEESYEEAFKKRYPERRPFGEAVKESGRTIGGGISRAAGRVESEARAVGREIKEGTEEPRRWLGEVPGKEKGRKAPRWIRPLTGTAKLLSEREELGKGGKPKRGKPRWARMASGAVEALGQPKEKKMALLFGRAPKELYDVSPGTVPAARALMPGMTPAGALHGQMAGAGGMIPAGAAHNVSLQGLRELVMPPNLRPAEQAAFAEIHRNGDVDTRKNVTTDLRQLGFSSREADGAITSLERKGHIEKTGMRQDGSPEFQITITVGGR